MVALSFPRGLHTGVGGSTPKHVHDALNVFEFGDNIIGRGGAGWVEDASRFVVGLGGLAYFAATSNGSTPASLTTTLPFTCTGERYLFFGYTAPFDRIRVTGTVSSLADDGDVYTAFPKVEYWNGSAWTEIKVARAWAPTYAIISGSDTSISRPCLAGTDDGQPGTGNLLSFAFNPPSDWATQTIDGDTLYILRVTLDATLNGNDAVFASGSAVHDPAVTPERVLCILPYNRRDGAGHQFVAFQSGDKTNANFYIYLDGTEQTWDTDIVRSAKVDETSDVWAVYHEATDHVYFRVAGVGWFAMPGGGGTIEQMDATGQGTIYESLDRGLRPAIPAPLPVTLFEGRLWAGEDGWLRWGASDVYPDVWPNEFERFVGDPLVCLVGTKTWMAAFSKRACYRVVNDGSADGYVVEKMLDGVGCVGPRAACAVGDVVFFLNTDGVYAMDGSGAIVKQSGAINEWWKSARAGRLSRAVMIYHGGYDQVRLFYPSNEERTILDEALYFNAEGYRGPSAGISRRWHATLRRRHAVARWQGWAVWAGPGSARASDGRLGGQGGEGVSPRGPGWPLTFRGAPSHPRSMPVFGAQM